MHYMPAGNKFLNSSIKKFTIPVYVRVLCLLLLGVLKADAHNIDSLRKLTTAAGTDKEKSVLLLETGRAYTSVNKDSATLYLVQALKLGQKTDNNDVCYNASRILGNVEKELYYNIDEAVRYHKLAMQYATGEQRQKRLATLHLSLAGDYLQTGNSYGEMNESDSAIQLAAEIHDTTLLCKGYDMMGLSYVLLEDFPKALDLLGHAISLYEMQGNRDGMAREYSLVATVFQKQKNNDKALEYYQKAEKIFIAEKDSSFMGQNEVNMAILYQETGNYKQAIKLLKPVLAGEHTHNAFWVVTCLNLATAQSKSGAYEDAQANFKAIEEIFSGGLHNPYLEGATYAARAHMLLRMKQYDLALYYAKKNETLLSQYSATPEDIREAMLLLAEVFNARGDMKAAYNYRVKYSAINDSITQSERTKEYVQAETKFHLAERDNTIKLLSKENELQKTLNKKDKIISISLASSLLLGLFFTGFVIAAYRRSLRKNALLSEQKQIIDDQVILLANAATMKSKFLGNISHELRTPVTLLTGMLELMQETKQTNGIKEKDRLEIALDSSRKLQHMVEEILDLTKLENNTAQPTFEVREVAPLLKRIVYTFETLTDKEQLKLEFHDEQASGIYLSIDIVKFEKLINNLVYNAIKFNHPNGWIRVSIYRGADPKLAYIDVIDSGKGISKEDLPHIFEHFYQGSTAGAKADGAGIGLALVAEFTTLMGGKVDVKSTQGTGTTFSLTFPLVEKPATEVAEMDSATLPEEAWENFTERQTVLLAEDNAEMRYYIREVLGDKVNIATAGNGIEALKWMETHTPDLIISDVMMPGMNGRELITELKNAEQYSRIPIITLTALADTENQLSFLRMGVDDYIVKPFNPDELRIRVYNLLTNYAARKEFNAQPAEPDDIPADTKEADTFRKTITDYVLARLKVTNVSVFDLAYEMAMSERQLYRLSKNLTGCSPAQLIKEVRLQKARELLLSGEIYKIEDVSKRVGFEKASYFSQQFLERFGKRPSEFL
jgi:signal transduction histidine kinase/DNA-binding response OmpR family regulator